jgi:CheY-specific phosphatase CheX
MEKLEDAVTIIQDVVSSICELGFGFEVTPSLTEKANLENYYVALVHILGDWNGAVAIQMEKTLVRDAVKLIFESENPKDDLQCRQFIQEFVNMVGGNLKPMLGDKCVLSTPKSFIDDEYLSVLTESQEKVKLSFDVLERNFIVSLYESPLLLNDYF